MRFEGKVVIVTGGGQGIGETYAKSFAAAGASVVIAELNKEGGQRVANEITEAGQAAFFVETDVSSEQDAAAAAAAAQDQFGGVDMDYYYQIMKVNMHSPLVMTRAVAASMVQRGGGCVINQSSTAAWKAQGGYYGVAKLGVQGLTMCLASELGDRNIRVNAIAPGPTDTEATRQVPAEILAHVVNGLALKRLGETADVVNLAKFLASDEAAWITGQTFRVDGGDTLLPA
jgi:3-oxoacyl-[acyl-carrier protein] reductase